MQIARLDIAGFAGLPDGVYDFAPNGEAARMVAIVAGQGAGKSSLLRAIAAAKLSFAPSAGLLTAQEALRPGLERGRLEALWLLDAKEADRARTSDLLVTTVWEFARGGCQLDAPAGLRSLFAPFDATADGVKMELIPEELVTTTPPREVPSARVLSAQRESNRADKYAWAPVVLTRVLLAHALDMRVLLRDRGVLVEGETDNALDPFRRGLDGVARHLTIGAAIDFGEGPEVTFRVARQPEAVPWRRLSAVDRVAVAVVVASVYLGLSRSIVLWDSADRSLGAHACSRVLAGLAQGLPNAQIFASLDLATLAPEGACVITLRD